VAAAEHFVPSARSPERNQQLVEVLRTLWPGTDKVEMHRCRACGFAFPIPYVAGDGEFYNVAYGDPHYPRDRWEFRRTLAALHPERGIRLLEVGAGEGWFLEMLRRSEIGRYCELSALEYDRAAITKLRARGFLTTEGSLIDLLGDPAVAGRFDVICMFQTLEHMDRVEDVFRALRHLLSPNGCVFISVPNAPSVDQQEQMVQLWDMPPNHVGRWHLNCFDVLCARHRFQVSESAVQPLDARRKEAWRLAMYRVSSRAYHDRTWEHRINAVRSRPLRVVLKGLTVLAWTPAFWFKTRQLIGHNLWVHLESYPVTVHEGDERPQPPGSPSTRAQAP
jgi:SAM-dependent methyltransferase